jgi:cytochrome c-type biogenesis protein CcmH
MDTRNAGRRVAGLLLLVVILPIGALAQGLTDAEVRAQEVFTRVMSPYCPGRTLAACPSGAAIDLRQQIIKDISAGVSPADVEAALYRKFGDDIRGEPKTDGLGLMAWVLPVVFAVSLAAGLASWLHRHVRRDASELSPAPESSRDLNDRLDEELSRL